MNGLPIRVPLTSKQAEWAEWAVAVIPDAWAEWVAEGEEQELTEYPSVQGRMLEIPDPAPGLLADIRYRLTVQAATMCDEEGDHAGGRCAANAWARIRACLPKDLGFLVDRYSEEGGAPTRAEGRAP